MATKADIRAALLRVMAEKNSTNIIPLEYAVNRVLTAQQGGSLALDRFLEPADKRLFFELVWELISTGVLVPYGDSSNSEWPQVSLTTEGLAYAETGEPSPAAWLSFSSTPSQRRKATPYMSAMRP